MNIALKKLCNEINFELNEHWEDVYLEEANLDEDKIFNLNFQSENLLPLEEIKRFFESLNTNFKYRTRPQFTLINKNFDKNLLIEYIVWILDDILKERNLSFAIKKAKGEIDINGNLNLVFNSSAHLDSFNVQKQNILDKLFKLGVKNFEIIASTKELKLSDTQTFEFEVAKFLNESVLKNSTKSQSVGFERRKANYKSVQIEELRSSHEKFVQVIGKVFKIENTTTKTGLKIFTIYITNTNESIVIKKFLNNDEEANWYMQLNINDYVEVKGTLSNDTYLKDFSILVDQIAKVPPTKIVRGDEEQTKRIELNLRTKMSAMDGVASVSEYFNRARHWNHPAFAITDLENVHAFPELHYLAKKEENFKPIFGATLNVLERDNKTIIGTNNHLLKNATYVVFDLETTGLYACYENLIEFGASKIDKSFIITEKQFFINPGKKIPMKIQEITNITDEMVKDAISEKEALQQIVSFFGDAILIAHNAKFDMAFINRKLEQYNMPAIQNPVIDSLQVSRAIFPQLKRHSLEFVAQRHKIEYDQTVAHRGDYDAHVLANVWLKMIDSLEKININSVLDLQKLNTAPIYERQFPKQITILVKTKEGLKNLYKLVSLSHTKNYYGRPIVFKDDLEHYRKGLLIGSSGINGFVYEAALNGTHRDLMNEIIFFDYIEVQPIKNYSHLLKREELTEETLQDATRKIIAATTEANKLVVATSEARYVDKRDSKLHHIYIETKGLGNTIHPLFSYHELEPDYPLLYFRNTKEMKREFSFLNDSSIVDRIVVDNTHEISKMIDRINIIPKGLFSPRIENADKLLEELVWKKAHARYGSELPEIIQKRLEKELTAITKYKYDVIYWIAHKLVAKSLSDGYIVGSRGSVGSSLVATLSGITEVNPLEPHYYCAGCTYTEFSSNKEITSGYDLPDKNCNYCNVPLKKDGHTIPFETFLGFNGEKVPDIDLNFSGDYQSVIHDEVKNMFGATHSFRAGTISTVAERTAYGYIKGWSEKNNIEVSPPFLDFLAGRISGTKRTTGQHPGGIMVVPTDMEVEEFTPVNYPANDISSSWLTTHFDFNSLHDNLLKLDLLGHDDPTAIRMLQDLTNIVPGNVPVSDEKVLKLFSSTEPLNIKPEDISGETTGAMGIPEFGTNFVRGILKSVKVSSFSDLISISGLSHGTDVWTNNAKDDVKNLNLKLNEIISCRDDIMIDLITKYGIDKNQAFTIMEQVRKGKGITNEQDNALRLASVPQWYINSLRKIKYMFPKAHATAYVQMAWKIAWFKIYYPLEYYATYFTTRSNVFDIKIMSSGMAKVHNRLEELQIKSRKRILAEKASQKEIDLIPILEITEELYARGFKISKISIHKSLAKKWLIAEDHKSLIPPFIALDGLGITTANSIIEERNRKPFISIEDFAKRTAVTKTNIDDLKEIGSLEDMDVQNQMSLFS